MIFKLVYKKKTCLMKEKILNGSVKITAVDQKKLSYNLCMWWGPKYWCDNLLKAVYVGLLLSWVYCDCTILYVKHLLIFSFQIFKRVYQ